MDRKGVDIGGLALEGTRIRGVSISRSLKFIGYSAFGECDDLTDMMKRFSLWRGSGKYTDTGKTFDVGRTFMRAISRFWDGYPAEYCVDNSIGGNGNGALMRTFPIALYQCFNFHGERLSEFLLPIHEVSRLTHVYEIGLLCGGIFSLTLKELLAADRNHTLLDDALITYNYGMETYGSLDDFKNHLENLYGKALMRVRDELQKCV